MASNIRRLQLRLLQSPQRLQRYLEIRELYWALVRLHV